MRVTWVQPSLEQNQVNITSMAHAMLELWIFPSLKTVVSSSSEDLVRIVLYTEKHRKSSCYILHIGATNRDRKGEGRFSEAKTWHFDIVISLVVFNHHCLQLSPSTKPVCCVLVRTRWATYSSDFLQYSNLFSCRGYSYRGGNIWTSLLC